MAQKVIDLSGQKGLYTKHSGDFYNDGSNTHLHYLVPDGEMVSGFWNPNRQTGYMAPAVNTFLDCFIETETGSPTIDPPFMLAYKHANNYIFTDQSNQYFPEQTVDAVTQLNAVSKYSLISLEVRDDSNSDVNDIILYQLNGNDTFFWIADNEIHTESSISGTLTQNDWQSSVADNPTSFNSLEADNNARFIDGRNGLLYVLDSYFIHAIDGSIAVGANGRFDAKVLTFPEHYNLIDGVELNGKIYISFNVDGDVFSSIPTTNSVDFQCGVYIWNKKTAIGSIQEAIMIEGVKDIKHIWSDNQGLYCITTSATGTVQIRKFNGNAFPVIKNLEKGSGTPLTRSSILVTEIGTFIVTNTGVVYQLNIGGDALYKLAELPGTINSSHAVVMLYAGSNNGYETNNSAQGVVNPVPHLMFAYTDSSQGNGIRFTKLFLHNHGTMTAEDFDSTDMFDDLPLKANAGNVFTPVTYLPKRSNARNLTIYCKPVQDSDTTEIATIKVYLNQETTATHTKTVTREQAARGYIDIEMNRNDVNAIQLEIIWDTTQTMGENDFMPSQAVFTYDPIYSSR